MQPTVRALIDKKSENILCLTEFNSFSVFTEILTRIGERFVFLIKSLNSSDNCLYSISCSDSNVDGGRTMCVGTRYTTEHLAFFREKDQIMTVFELEEDSGKPLYEQLDRFFEKNIPEFPENFDIREFENILYKKKRDPTISGIAMIDIPIETV